MKKILITYATYGNGHKAIAEYIANYLDKNKYEIKLLNIMDYVGFLCNFSLKIHNFVTGHRFEHLFSFMYTTADNKLTVKLYNFLFRKIIYNKRVQKVFLDFNPDLVISSHFYGSNAAYYLKRKGLLDAKIMTIITDYSFHNFWTANDEKDEIFIVANDIVKREMIEKDVVSKNIYSYGLPFDILKFNDVMTKEKILKKYHIKENKKVVLLFMGGGNGSNAYMKYYKTLVKMNIPNTEIIVVCGKNESVKEETELFKKYHNKKNIHILGFVNNVYELLKISDIVISKPGGATVTECLETKNIMIVLPGIGGQEKYNARFICKNNHGVKVRFTFTFKKALLTLLKNEKEFKKLKNSYNKVSKNESLEKISKLIKKVLK